MKLIPIFPILIFLISGTIGPHWGLGDTGYDVALSNVANNKDKSVSSDLTRNGNWRNRIRRKERKIKDESEMSEWRRKWEREKELESVRQRKLQREREEQKELEEARERPKKMAEKKETKWSKKKERKRRDLRKRKHSKRNKADNPDNPDDPDIPDIPDILVGESFDRGAEKYSTIYTPHTPETPGTPAIEGKKKYSGRKKTRRRPGNSSHFQRFADSQESEEGDDRREQLKNRLAPHHKPINSHRKRRPHYITKGRKENVIESEGGSKGKGRKKGRHPPTNHKRNNSHLQLRPDYATVATTDSKEDVTESESEGESKEIEEKPKRPLPPYTNGNSFHPQRGPADITTGGQKDVIKSKGKSKEKGKNPERLPPHAESDNNPDKQRHVVNTTPVPVSTTISYLPPKHQRENQDGKYRVI